MTFKKWVLELFKDERGSTSIKPVIGFICSMFLCVTLSINSFSHGDIKPSDALVDAVMYIAIAALIGDTGDKFSFRKKTEEANTEYNG